MLLQLLAKLLFHIKVMYDLCVTLRQLTALSMAPDSADSDMLWLLFYRFFLISYTPTGG